MNTFLHGFEGFCLLNMQSKVMLTFFITRKEVVCYVKVTQRALNVRSTTIQFLDYFCLRRKLQNVFKNSKKQTLYMFITLAFKETETLLAAKTFTWLLMKNYVFP